MPGTMWISNEITVTPNPMIDVGNGFTDVTPQQIVRDNTNRLWVSGYKFDEYPWGSSDGVSHTLRMYKADQVGAPTSFTRMDSANEPSAPSAWAMAIDGSNVIHIAWVERASLSGGGVDNNLKYCQFSNGVWGTVATIDNDLDMTDMGQGDEMVSLAVDSDGVPHVVYADFDGTNRRVYYRNRIGGTWSASTTVDDQTLSGSNNCFHPGICFDNAGRIVVVWNRGTNGTGVEGTIFVRVYSGSWGTTHQIDGTDMWDGIDTGNRVYVDSSGRYHVSYLDGDKYIQYKYSDDQGATWTANDPGSGTALGDDPGVGPGTNGKVRIYAHDERTPVGISYWEGDGGSASWGSRLEYTADGEGPFDCSVNVRWSQYFHHYPSILDIAYWKSTYSPGTNELYVGVDT